MKEREINGLLALNLSNTYTIMIKTQNSTKANQTSTLQSYEENNKREKTNQKKKKKVWPTIKKNEVKQENNNLQISFLQIPIRSSPSLSLCR